MPALPQAADGREDLLLVDEPVILHPVHGVQRVVGEDAHEGRVARRVAALEGLGVVEVRRVLDAHGLLALRIRRVQRALAGVGVATVDVHLLKHDDGLARLGGRHGGGQRRAAGADDDHVGLIAYGLGSVHGGVALHDGAHVGASGLGALGHGRGEGHGGEGGASHGIDRELLGVQVVVGQETHGGIADVAALHVVGLDGGDAVGLEGHRHFDLAVAALSGRLVGAGSEGRRGIARGGRRGLRRATGKTERGERHGGEAAADELAAVQLELLRDVAMDTGEGALTTREGLDLVGVLNHSAHGVLLGSPYVLGRLSRLLAADEAILGPGPAGGLVHERCVFAENPYDTKGVIRTFPQVIENTGKT